MSTGRAANNSLLVLVEWPRNRLEKMAPWTGFIDLKQFSAPKDGADARTRLGANLPFYFSNYLVIGLVISAYSLLTNPLVLIVGVLVGLAGLWTAQLSPVDSIALGPVTLERKQILWVWLVVSGTVLWYASAFSVLFWCIGVTAVVVGMHAVAHEPIPKSPLPS